MSTLNLHPQTTPGADLIRPRDHESPSSLCDADRCLRRHFLSRGIGIAGGSEEHAALSYGKAMHLAFPVALDKGVDTAYEVFCTVWGDDRTDGDRNNIVAARSIANFKETLESAALFTLIKPHTLGLQRLPKPIPTDDPDPRECSEWEYEFDLDLDLDIGTRFTGRLDGLGRLTADNTLWPVEYKTTSKLGGNYFFDAFQLSPQLISYVLATRILLPHENIPGAIVVASRVSKANSETIPQCIFVRDHHIENHIHWIREQARRIQQAKDTKNWPTNYNGCHPYSQFGSPGYACEYMPLCRDTEDWTTMRGLFRQKEEKVVAMTVAGQALEVTK